MPSKEQAVDCCNWPGSFCSKQIKSAPYGTEAISIFISLCPLGIRQTDTHAHTDQVPQPSRDHMHTKGSLPTRMLALCSVLFVATCTYSSLISAALNVHCIALIDILPSVLLVHLISQKAIIIVK